MKKQTWHIRRAEVSDAKAIGEVLCRSVYEVCAPDYGNNQEYLDGWCANKTPENIAAWIQAPTNYFFVAESETGFVVGASLVDDRGDVRLCYVVPEALDLGVGHAMLQAMERTAIELGLSSLVTDSTITARAFYKRNGFVEEGELLDEEYPSYRMRKPLRQ